MLTLAFLSHHSRHLINKLVDEIINYDLGVKILIIENSIDHQLKYELESKYKKQVKVYLPNENLGFSKGMNKAIELSDDQFVFLNPADVILSHTCIQNLLNCLNNFKDFTLLAPTYKDEKIYKNYEEFLFSKERETHQLEIENFNLKEVDWIDGTFIVNKEKIENNKIMDENIFIYFETMDMCLNFKKKNQKMFVVENIKFEHIGGSSHERKFNFEAKLSRNWHYNWSKFYYFKKNFSYLYALKKFSTVLFKNALKLLYYFMTRNKENYLLKKAEINGSMHSILLNKSNYRPYKKI